MQKHFFWHLSQVLTNLVSFLLLHNSVISLFRHFFHFSSTTTTFLLFSLLLISAVLPPPPPLHFSLFSSSFSSSFLLFSVPLLLISIVFRPFSPHFYCLPSPYFCCFLSSSSSFLLFCLLLVIHHFHIDHNASCSPPRPLKFSITIVSNFPWVLQSPQEKSKTMVMQNCGSKQSALWFMWKWWISIFFSPPSLSIFSLLPSSSSSFLLFFSPPPPQLRLFFLLHLLFLVLLIPIVFPPLPSWTEWL